MNACERKKRKIEKARNALSCEMAIDLTHANLTNSHRKLEALVRLPRFSPILFSLPATLACGSLYSRFHPFPPRRLYIYLSISVFVCISPFSFISSHRKSKIGKHTPRCTFSHVSCANQKWKETAMKSAVGLDKHGTETDRECKFKFETPTRPRQLLMVHFESRQVEYSQRIFTTILVYRQGMFTSKLK